MSRPLARSCLPAPPTSSRPDRSVFPCYERFTTDVSRRPEIPDGPEVGRRRLTNGVRAANPSVFVGYANASCGCWLAEAATAVATAAIPMISAGDAATGVATRIAAIQTGAKTETRCMTYPSGCVSVRLSIAPYRVALLGRRLRGKSGTAAAETSGSFVRLRFSRGLCVLPAETPPGDVELDACRSRPRWVWISALAPSFRDVVL